LLEVYVDLLKVVYVYPVLRIRIREPVPFWPLDPGSGIGYFLDLWSRIPNPHFWELNDNFWVKNSIILWKLTQIFFFSTSKLTLCTILSSLWLLKKVWHQIFFRPSVLLLFLDPISGIQDPGSGMGKNQDPGSGINISNLQHCVYLIFLYSYRVTSQSKLLGLSVNRISAPPHPQYLGTYTPN
jgi:hypothetical protein